MNRYSYLLNERFLLYVYAFVFKHATKPRNHSPMAILSATQIVMHDFIKESLR